MERILRDRAIKLIISNTKRTRILDGKYEDVVATTVPLAKRTEEPKNGEIIVSARPPKGKLARQLSVPVPYLVPWPVGIASKVVICEGEYIGTCGTVLRDDEDMCEVQTEETISRILKVPIGHLAELC